MNDNLYRPPQSQLSGTKTIRNWPILALLYIMLATKFFAIYLFLGFIMQPPIPGVQVEFVLSKFLYHSTYTVISLFCIIGLIMNRMVSYNIFIILMVTYGLFYLFIGDSVYQSVIDPMFVLVFTLLIAHYRPNKWCDNLLKRSAIKSIVNKF